MYELFHKVSTSYLKICRRVVSKNVSMNCFVDELSCSPQVKEMRDYSGYKRAKIKLLKVLSSYTNALCDSTKLFITTINPGDVGPLDVLRKVRSNSQA